MPKLKAKKTLLKRLRITRNGKMVRGQIRTGHLKVKWSTNKRLRKAKKKIIISRGYRRKFKKLLG